MIKWSVTAACDNLIQGGSYMTGTDLCVRLYKSVPVIFEPPCICDESAYLHLFINRMA